MSSNTITTNSTPPPLVRTELRPKADPLEDAVQQVKKSSDSAIPSGSAHLTSENQPAKVIAADAKTPDTQVQNAKILAEAVDKINQYVVEKLPKIHLQFNIDDQVDRLVVKVIDVEKEELIRQIPPDEALALVAALKEKIEKESQQMERAAGLTPGLANLEGLLLRDQV